MQKNNYASTMSVDAHFCKAGDPNDCIKKYKILDRVVMPTPVCAPDGSMHQPDGKEGKREREREGGIV